MLSSYTENLPCIRSFVFQTSEKQFKELRTEKLFISIYSQIHCFALRIGRCAFRNHLRWG